MADARVRAEKLSKTFGAADTAVRALAEVDLQVLDLKHLAPPLPGRPR